MGTPDPSLGISVDFDVAAFENGIRFAMQMGTPNDSDKRPKFIRKGTGRTYWKDGVQLGSTPRLDQDGTPLDPDIEVRRDSDTVITTPKTDEGSVDCAIAIQKAGRAELDEQPVGNLRGTKAEVTVLPSDYATIADCREMLYNGDTYVYGYEPEVNGLFGSGVHTLVFYCLDDS